MAKGLFGGGAAKIPRPDVGGSGFLSRRPARPRASSSNPYKSMPIGKSPHISKPPGTKIPKGMARPKLSPARSMGGRGR